MLILAWMLLIVAERPMREVAPAPPGSNAMLIAAEPNAYGMTAGAAPVSNHFISMSLELNRPYCPEARVKPGTTIAEEDFFFEDVLRFLAAGMICFDEHVAHRAARSRLNSPRLPEKEVGKWSASSIT